MLRYACLEEDEGCKYEFRIIERIYHPTKYEECGDHSHELDETNSLSTKLIKLFVNNNPTITLNKFITSYWRQQEWRMV